MADFDVCLVTNSTSCLVESKSSDGEGLSLQAILTACWRLKVRRYKTLGYWFSDFCCALRICCIGDSVGLLPRCGPGGTTNKCATARSVDQIQTLVLAC